MRIAGKPFNLPADLIRQIKFVSPNLHELNEIAKTLNYTNDIPTGLEFDELLASHATQLKSLATEVNNHIDNILITLGSRGLLLVSKSDGKSQFFNANGRFIGPKGDVNSQMRLYPAQNIDDVVNVSGAGDSFSSGFITAMIRGQPEAVCVAVGFQSALTALRGPAAVPEKYFGVDHKCWRREANCTDF